MGIQMKSALVAVLTLVATMVASINGAHAHRSGESYVYVNVTESGMSGKLHITLAHIAEGVELAATTDGVLTQEEFEQNTDAIFAFFQSRIAFYEGDIKHGVRFTTHEFFGPENDVWVNIGFEMPTMGPPPETLDM